ncbi:hypothetical protein BH10BAC2_BH10BAC2_36330 [soil metagenome]
MLNKKINITNKSVALNGAVLAVAAVFTYSLIVMIYVIIRSSATIYSIMPGGERSNILLANGFSIAYSVAIFSLLMALLSSAGGAVAALILKKSLLGFNAQFNFTKAVVISSITASAWLIMMYLLLYTLLKEWMTFDYAGTFLFWFLFPAAIFFAVSIVGGSKLNKILDTGITQLNKPETIR